MFKKILVPLDGSEHSRKIVGWATGLAEALGAEITLLSVIDPEEIEILEATTHAVGEVVPGEGSTSSKTARTPSDVIDDAIAQAESDLQVEAEKSELQESPPKSASVRAHPQK